MNCLIVMVFALLNRLSYKAYSIQVSLNVHSIVIENSPPYILFQGVSVKLWKFMGFDRSPPSSEPRCAVGAKPETEQQSEPWETQRISGSMRIMIMKPFNVFHDPHRKGRSSLSGVSLTLQYLEGGGNQASPKPSPLRGFKSQPIQPLFVGKVTKVSHQLRIPFANVERFLFFNRRILQF